MKHRPEVIKIFRREMLKLRSEYITHSLAQVQALRSRLQRQRGSRLTPQELSSLIAITHRLRGSGQTYDLPDLTHWMSILESELRSIEENGGRLSAKQRRALLSRIDALISLLEAEQEATT